MIRGVKVRQPGKKSESKKPGKSQKNQHATSTTADGANEAPSSSAARKKQIEDHKCQTHPCATSLPCEEMDG